MFMLVLEKSVLRGSFLIFLRPAGDGCEDVEDGLVVVDECPSNESRAGAADGGVGELVP
jgi:hypothetical protein